MLLRRSLYRKLFHRTTFQARHIAHSFPYRDRRSLNQVDLYLHRAKLIDSIRLCLRSGSPDSLLPILDDPNLDSFVVTNALLSAPSPDSALSFVKLLQRVPDFVHSQHSLHALAKILAKSGRIAELKKLIAAINDGKFDKVLPVSFMDQMRWFALAGEIEEVLDVWDEYRAQGKRPCKESYNIVMSLYARDGKNLDAVKTFYRLIEEGGIPNSRTYTVIIEHLVNSKKVDVAKEIFDMLPLLRTKHTLKQFSVLMESFSNLRQYDALKDLIADMKVEGLLPGRSMLGSLQLMQEAGFLQETDNIIKDMLPDNRIHVIEISKHYSGDDDDDGDDDGDNDEEDEDENDLVDDGDMADKVKLKPWLDPSALASALRHWKPEEVLSLEDAKFVWTRRLVCKMIRQFKKAETAWQFFCWVAYQLDFIHDVHTVSRMMVKLARSGNHDLVDQLISKLKDEGMKLEFSTVRLIIDFYGLSKKADAALNIFQDVQTLCGEPISESQMLLLCSSLLRALAKCGRDSDAMNLVEEMLAGGIHPDIQMFSGLMHHFALKGDFSTVQKLFGHVRQSGVKPDAYMYKVLIHAYCKCGRAALALRLFEDMRNSHLIPDRYTKSVLVKSLWKEGRLKEAAHVEESCEGIDETLPLALPGHLFTVSSVDLMRVYKSYHSSFATTTSEDKASFGV